MLAGQLPLWRRVARKDRPWQTRITGLRFKCPGCGQLKSLHRRCFCARCKKRNEAGLPLDLDDFLTDAEYRRLARRMPGEFMQPRRGQR